MNIQIREETKIIPRIYLSEILNISRSRLYRKIKKGEILSPSNENGYSRSEIEQILNEKHDKLRSKMLYFKNNEIADIYNCSLNYVNNGIFLHSPKAQISIEELYSEMIENYGRWNAQRLNNHVHLKYIEFNPIHQLILAKFIIDSWISQLVKKYMNKDAVIYWNGVKDSTICIYSGDNIDEGYLLNFDERLKIKNVIVRNIVI